MSTAVVALIQTDPGPDKPANLERTIALVEEAARAGADWVALPETFHCRGPREVKLAAAEPIDGPLARALSGAAGSTACGCSRAPSTSPPTTRTRPGTPASSSIPTASGGRSTARSTCSTSSSTAG
jgi:hypothetical protein